MTRGQGTERPTTTGWYPDPGNSGRERYWNGNAWAAWTGSQGEAYPAKPPSALVMWGMLSLLMFPPAGIAVGILLVTRGRRRAGIWIAALNVVATLAAVVLLA